MAFVFTPKRSPINKPTGARIDIDRRHSLAKGLAFAVVPTGGHAGSSDKRLPRDLVTGKYPTIQVGASSDFANSFEQTAYPNTTRESVFRSASNSSGVGILNYGRTMVSAMTGAGTIFADTKFYANGASRPCLLSDAENANGYGFNFFLDDANRVTNGFWLNMDANDRGTPAYDTLGTSAELRQHRLAMVWTGTTFNYYAAKKLQQTESVTISPTGHANRVTKLFGRRDDFVPYCGNLGVLYVFSRAIDIAEYKALFDNPWQILRTRPTVFVFGPSASGFSGTGAGTLSAVTGSSAGTFYGLFTGTGAGSLTNATGSASGTFATTGTGAGALQSATASASGSFATTGTASGITQNITASASGSFATSGTGAGTLQNATGAASGTFYGLFIGTGAGALQNATGTASGAFTTTGTGAGALSNATASASGAFTGQGTASGILQAIVGTASGSFTTTGTAGGILSAIVSAASGSFTAAGTFSGTGAGTIGTVAGSASGTFYGLFTGSASGALQAITATASGWITNAGTGAGTLQLVTGSVSGTYSGLFTGTGAGVLATIAASASGVTISQITGTGAGTLSAIIGQAYYQALATAVFFPILESEYFFEIDEPNYLFEVSND